MAALQHSQPSAGDLQPTLDDPVAHGHHYRLLPPKIANLQISQPSPPQPTDRLFFLAQKQPDGTYSVALTEDGIQTFETALGVAADLGGQSRISPRSTIADLMERTATREELSQLLRRGGTTLPYHLRIRVLRRRLRATEAPSARQKTISHLGKVLIVTLIGIWALMQFITAVEDIAAIPGILAGIPGDLLQLHPTTAFNEVGSKISDAGTRVLAGILGALLTYLAAKLIQPFGTIYRMDQLVPGERLALALLNRLARTLDERRQAAHASR